jgi:hypothetical protein
MWHGLERQLGKRGAGNLHGAGIVGSWPVLDCYVGRGANCERRRANFFTEF